MRRKGSDGNGEGGALERLWAPRDSDLVDLLAAAIESPSAVPEGEPPLTCQRQRTCQNDGTPLRWHIEESLSFLLL